VGGESYTSARLKSEFGIDPSTVLKAGALHTVTALSNPSPMLLRLN
jgi:hypothetical protein